MNSFNTEYQDFGTTNLKYGDEIVSLAGLERFLRDATTTTTSSSEGLTYRSDSLHRSEKGSIVDFNAYRPGSKKRYAPKVKTGCMTCKKRRVKCDEAKPTCRRCSTTDRSCEYQPVQTWLFTNQRKSSLKAARNENLPGYAMMPFYGTAEEKKYLDLFLRLTAPWLSTYCMPDFFQELLPQSSWQHPALRHALVAVSMATEGARLHPGATDTNRKTWHYYEAVRSLSSDLFVGEETILLTCLMFWLHDNISINSDSAMTHLTGALKIINERRTGKRKYQRGDIISTRIEPTLVAGLMFSAATVNQAYSGPLDPTNTYLMRKYLRDPKYAHPRTNMDNVREEFSLVIKSFAYAVKRHIPDSNGFVDKSRPTFSELRSFLEKWFRAYSRVDSHTTPADRKLLECHYICATIVVDCYEFGVDSGQIKEPKSLTRFEYILDQIESLEPKELVQAPLGKDLHMAVIPLLTSMAKLCPCSDIQTRAIQKLKSLDRMEGFWHSSVAADLLERVNEVDRQLQSYSAIESATGLTPFENDLYLPSDPFSIYRPHTVTVH